MKLPKRAYIRIEKSGDEEWLATATSANDHAEIGEKRKVGIYRLERVVTVTAEVREQK